jgi:hypothetical protein
MVLAALKQDVVWPGTVFTLSYQSTLCFLLDDAAPSLDATSKEYCLGLRFAYLE